MYKSDGQICLLLIVFEVGDEMNRVDEEIGSIEGDAIDYLFKSPGL